MSLPRLGRLELQIMEILWTKGVCSVREILDEFPEKGRPAFTTVQTTIYRMEGKKAIRCVKRIGRANIFEAVVSRDSAERRLVDELLGLLGGRSNRVMSHLIRTGKVSLQDIKEAELELRRLIRKEKP